MTTKPQIIYKFGLLHDDVYVPKSYPVPNIGDYIQVGNKNWVVTKLVHYIETWENCIAIICNPLND